MKKNCIIFLVLINIVFANSTKVETVYFKDVIKYFSLNEKEFKKENIKYEIVPAGPEGGYDGYQLENLDITLVFQNNILVFIECGENININGALAKTTFKEIQKKLGQAKLEKIFVETEDHPAYRLTYFIEKRRVTFDSYQKIGKDIWVTIYKD